MRSIERCTLTLDPKNWWVITNATIEARNGKDGISTIKRVFTYEKNFDGYPLLKEIKESIISDDKSYNSEGIYKFEFLAQAKIPTDSDFTLKAFNIPEAARKIASQESPFVNQLSESKSNSTPWYRWVIIISAVFVLTGFLLLLASKFRKAT